MGVIGVRSSSYVPVASSHLALHVKACILPRIGLLRYSGTAPLNQMRYTIQAIPTFGSIGSASGAEYTVTTPSSRDNPDLQLARPAVVNRLARPSGSDVG